MSKIDQFKQHIEAGYQFEGESILLGTAMLDEQAVEQTPIKIPLKTLNRHGLIAGATGTGKTKTMQLFAESLSDNGVPCLLMDLKGDLSGLAQAGKHHPKIEERHNKIGVPYEPTGYPVEMLTISKDKGARLRATVSEFGPTLFAQILNLNDTQQGIVAIIFKYCDDNQLPLLDLKDFKKTLNFCMKEGKEQIQELYGSISPASAGAILRRIVELEQQGGDLFFGEPSFEVEDLLRMDENGRGYLSIVRLTDIQDRPKLFSTFMLCLLAEIYNTFPEQGDADAPKLCIFIDEAHLVFSKASDALLEQLESIIKLIRSKGVGIFFVTQNPVDIPDAILGQLGLKLQHALRAFTAKDRKAIKLAAENYPISDYYKTSELITKLGIGECAATVLDEKGRPTPLAATLLRAPRSRMGTLTDAEIQEILDGSELMKKYSKDIDRESAYEILTAKLKAAQAEATELEAKAPAKSSSGRKLKEPDTMMESLSKNTMVRQLGRTVIREVTRGLLGVLGVKTTKSRSKKSSWF